MSYRDDILWAADMIERHPEAYEFSSVVVPDYEAPSCGSPGCALGWIAAHQDGHHIGRCFGIVWSASGECAASDPLGIDSPTFYKRMNALAPGWAFDARSCAAGLRLYADYYHPADDAIPESVRAVFDGQEQTA